MPSKNKDKPAKISQFAKRKSQNSLGSGWEVKSKTSQKVSGKNHFLFLPFVFLVFILWVVYRSLFSFEVWFDELIGKAVFLGMPVWLYMTATSSFQIAESFSLQKIKRGLWMGIAIGGIYGFIAAILGSFQRSGHWANAAFYVSDAFWWEFLLAMLTGFWETLFFYSFVMLIVQEKYRRWPLLNQLLLVMLVFTVFHLPNIVLRFSGVEIAYQIMLLALFSLGQGYLFASEKNGFALVLSHAIWGMVLLVHF
ncbi:MAG: hypothetical protein ACOZAN_02710 [Patescibacteria group bacterium]